MSGTILLGYDVETASESTVGFLEGAAELHDELDVPWTIYLTGKTAEAQPEAIRRVRDNSRLTIGQHTYSHMLLKSVYMDPQDGRPVNGDRMTNFVRGGSLEGIREEITKTQRIIADLFEIECHGLTGPWNYYRGLVDRPDILEVLADEDIRWIRTYGRDSRDCQPTPFQAQPFFYADQGFPDILEMGIHGYQDDFYWDRFDDRRHGDTYQDYLYATIDEVAENDWVWSLCSHDHGTPTIDAFRETKGVWLRDFITRAQSRGLRFLDPTTLYNDMKAAQTPD